MERVTALLDPGTAAGFPVHQGEHTGDLAARFFQGVDRGEGASAGRKGVLDDEDPGSGDQPPFDPIAGPMLFRSLPHGERVDRFPFDPAPMGDSIRDGVGTHREATEPVRIQASAPDFVQAHMAQEKLAFGGHGGPSGIHVVGRALPSGEDEIPEFEGTLHEKGLEAVAMIHTEECGRSDHPVKGTPLWGSRARGPGRSSSTSIRLPKRPFLRLAGMLAGIGLLLIPIACDSDPSGTDPSLPFGRVGEVEVRASTPLALGEGTVEESLVWSSTGAWGLRERITYRGFVGDEKVHQSRGNPSALAQDYASFIHQLHETRGLQLFTSELDPDLNPSCGGNESRFIFVIRDHGRDEEVEWVRCADGGLFSARPEGAGPDPSASRVVLAAQLTRLLTLGEDAQSEYRGSVPFGSFDRGEDTPTRLTSPRAFVAPDGELATAPSGWFEFWETHTEGDRAPPSVDWSREMVLVIGVGERFEAGDSVGVRRILQVADGTNVEVVERAPGDFCSPAPRNQYPFHIVVAPRTRLAIRFGEVRVERVPCEP